MRARWRQAPNRFGRERGGKRCGCERPFQRAFDFERQAALDLRSGGLGIAGSGAVEVNERLVLVALPQPRRAECEVRTRVLRICRKRAVRKLDRLGQAALLPAGESATGQHVGIVELIELGELRIRPRAGRNGPKPAHR